MFSTEHITWLCLCAVFVIEMCYQSAKRELSLKKAGYIMCAVGLCSEVSKIMSNMVPDALGGMHLDPLALPFHLCSMMLYGVVFITFAPAGKSKDLLINFTAVMGTVGSLSALLIPTNGTGFTEIGSYQCFVYHAALMWYSIYLIQAGQADLGRKGLKGNLIMLFSLVLLLLYINGALAAYNTNFLYLTRPPMEGLPYLNLNQGWYVYFLRILGAGTLVVVLFHLPFVIKERRSS